MKTLLIPRLVESIVYPSHVVKVVATSTTVQQLHGYLARGIIVVKCPSGNIDIIDVIIPIAMKKKESNNPIDINDHKTYDISAWFINVKDSTSTLSMDSLVSTFSKCSLVQQLSEMEPPQYQHTGQGHFGNVLFTVMNLLGSRKYPLKDMKIIHLKDITTVGVVDEDNVQEIQEDKNNWIGNHLLTLATLRKKRSATSQLRNCTKRSYSMNQRG